MRRFFLPIFILAVVVAVGAYVRYAPVEPPELPADAPPPAAKAPMAARMLTEEQKQAMRDVLASETGDVKKVWFLVEARRAENLAYQKAIEQVFHDAGWEVVALDSGNMTFKPGIYLLVADDEWPAYATTAYNAFQRAGIEVKAARGYRAYYEEQKKEKPGWTGPKLADDQTYVVLVGPNPPPSS
jgi:hypothetical protein